MTKYEWETELKKAMHELPSDEQKKVLEYYDELFFDRAEGGMSEKAIIAEFGNPIDVAFKIIGEYRETAGEDRPIAPPDVYSRKRDTEKFSTPDFWEGRAGRRPNPPAPPKKPTPSKAQPSAEAEDGTRTILFLIELFLLGGMFVGLLCGILGVFVGIAAFGISSAVLSVGAFIYGMTADVVIAARTMSFAVALGGAGIALIVIPHIPQLMKLMKKCVVFAWNALFGWYTKKEAA